MNKQELIQKIQNNELNDNAIAKLDNTVDLLIKKTQGDKTKFPMKIRDDKRSQFDILGEK